MSNAIKFTPAGGRVEVKLNRVAQEVRIQVSDNGQGINAEFLPHIFDRFRQEDGTTTRRFGGLGLGLSIVRHLVELHGGTVYADSPGEGLGAAFSISLPLPAGSKQPRRRRAESQTVWAPETVKGAPLATLPSLEEVKVLLVDDNQDTLQMLSVMLTESRAQVHVAASAEEALEVLQWYKPDVIVSDLAMPGEDGYSLIGKIGYLETKGGFSVPAVALTSHVRIEDRTRALSLGFNMFVPKPVEPTELISAIANLAESSTEEPAN